MKNIKQVAKNYRTSGALNFTDKPPEKLVVPKQAAVIVNDLFVKLKSIFPAWTHAFPNAELEGQAKREWITSFVENKVLHTKQIDLGLMMARKSKAPWFPAVGTFVDWCKPSLEKYGLLAPRKALVLAVNGNIKKCPAIAFAIAATGKYEIRTMRHTDLLKIFTRNYEIACERLMNGDDLTIEVPKALPKKVYIVAKQGKALEHVSKMKKLFKKGADTCH